MLAEAPGSELRYTAPRDFDRKIACISRLRRRHHIPTPFRVFVSKSYHNQDLDGDNTRLCEVCCCKSRLLRKCLTHTVQPTLRQLRYPELSLLPFLHASSHAGTFRIHLGLILGDKSTQTATKAARNCYTSFMAKDLMLNDRMKAVWYAEEAKASQQAAEVRDDMARKETGKGRAAGLSS